MVTGRDIQLARQIGEHLVAAELGRRGYIATPFAGNVPLFDLLAADLDGRAFSVQVKTARGFQWQLQADKFLEIEIDPPPTRTQRVRRCLELPNPNVICIFVMLKSDVPNALVQQDEFYILSISHLQKIVESGYKARLGVCNPRPKNATSTHCTVSRADLKNFRDNLSLLEGGRQMQNLLIPSDRAPAPP